MPKPPLNQLAFPPGRKPGVRKESTSERVARSKIAARCDPIKGQIEIIPRKHWDERADTIWHKNRRSRFRYVLDQNGVGSCAAESAAGTKAALDERQGLPEVVYNPWFLYQTTSGGRDNGSVIGDNVEFLRDHGACPEEVWPRSKGWRAEPSREAKRVAKFFRLIEFFYVETIDEFVSALLQGYDVHFGYSGHAVASGQYVKRMTIEYLNSWGIGWGDNGFGKLSLSKVYFSYGAYAYKNARVWTPEQWSPRGDQAALAKAVDSFMDYMNASSSAGRKVWTKRHDSWREDCYQGNFLATL